MDTLHQPIFRKSSMQSCMLTVYFKSKRDHTIPCPSTSKKELTKGKSFPGQAQCNSKIIAALNMGCRDQQCRLAGKANIRLHCSFRHQTMNIPTPIQSCSSVQIEKQTRGQCWKLACFWINHWICIWQGKCMPVQQWPFRCAKSQPCGN